MKKNRLNRRFEEDIWGLITIKSKPNKVTRFFQSLIKEKYSFKNKKSVVYRVEVTKPKRKKLVLSHYGKMLAFRRKLSAFYGNIRQKDLINIIKKVPLKKEVLSDGIIDRLESRLESLVYRLNFASSVREARKEIMRGAVSVNKSVVKVPGYEVSIGDIVEINPGYRKEIHSKILNRVENGHVFTNVPTYLEVNYKILAGCKISEAAYKNVAYPFKLKENYFKSFIMGK